MLGSAFYVDGTDEAMRWGARSWDLLHTAVREAGAGLVVAGAPLGEEPPCGDGQCGPNEGCLSCPTDCGPCEVGCGDGVCEPAPPAQEHLVFITDDGFEPPELVIQAGDSVTWFNEVQGFLGQLAEVHVFAEDGSWETILYPNVADASPFDYHKSP